MKWRHWNSQTPRRRTELLKSELKCVNLKSSFTDCASGVISRENAWERRAFPYCWIAAGTNGNGAPVVRTHRVMDGTANYFPTKNVLYCMILHIQSQNFLGGDTPDPQKRPRCLKPETNFRLACKRSHCTDFTKRPLLCVHFDWCIIPHTTVFKQIA